MGVNMFALFYYWVKRMQGTPDTNFSLKVKRIGEVRTRTKEISSKTCAGCGKEDGILDAPLKYCAGCKYTHYCGTACAKKHWVRNCLPLPILFT